MRITARYGVDPKEEVTLQYPEERWEIPQGYRGFLHNDILKCTACTMCVKVCPVDCISLESVRGADKKMVLASYDINIGRCMYCGLCVEVCPPKSLKHTSGYEMASGPAEADPPLHRGGRGGDQGTRGAPGGRAAKAAEAKPPKRQGRRRRNRGLVPDLSPSQRPVRNRSRRACPPRQSREGGEARLPGEKE
jgi:formate hydrogenlyase subunit 6/NADH:ubiquinone oxidoreductase subunit I